MDPVARDLSTDAFLQMTLDIALRLQSYVAPQTKDSVYISDGYSDLDEEDEESLITQLREKLLQLPASKDLPTRQSLADRVESIFRQKAHDRLSRSQPSFIPTLSSQRKFPGYKVSFFR